MKFLALSVVVHLGLLVAISVVKKPQPGVIVPLEMLRLKNFNMEPAKGLKGLKSSKGLKSDKEQKSVRNLESDKQQATAEQQSELEQPLQAKKFLYASFYGRVKREIDGKWRPLVAKLLRTRQKLLTVVVIKLDKAGNVVDKYVLESCSDQKLDNAALQSISSLYPNPPAALFQTDNFAKLFWRFEINY